MVQAGIAGLDTPRTNAGDATFLSTQQLDFDISQEQSFQSPSKDNNNLITQLQNGRRGINLKTPRSRVALGDRRNLPAGLGGGEFTPLLKSATRNSAVRNGKENVPQTPGFGRLDNIPEDFSPLPVMGSSIYGQDSRNGSYIAGTPIPQIDSSSTASTPMALLPRRNEGPGVLQDGNQLSLREQENVIDKIEKENFGLKLKIHFLEEALRKAGPGFSEAALKENTELKVDKVTMQKELHRYRKTLGAAERDVEVYRQQLLEMQEKVKRKHMDDGQREELDRLRQGLEEKEAELDELRRQEGKVDDLQDKIIDLDAELREKDRAINDREDEVDNLKDEVEKHATTISNLQIAMKDAQRRAVELEEKAHATEDLDEAKETIDELERDLERLRNEAQDAKEDQQEAFQERDRAQADLEELQDEMANKSITTKGLSRQIEEKANRLQDELEDLREKHSTLAEDYEDKARDIKKLQGKIEDLKQDGDVREQKLKDKLEIVQNENAGAVRERSTLATNLEVLKSELQQKGDEKDLLQVRHDALTSESASLQRDLSKSQRTIEDLEDKLKHEQTLALTSEREVRDEYKDELDRLNADIDLLKDKVEDLEAEVRQKERLYDDDSDKWESERRSLESERDRAEEKVTGLQRTIDGLQEAEGTLSGKETKFHQALQSEKDRHTSEEAALTRQINELNDDVDIRRRAMEEIRSEFSTVREELRLSQREQKALAEKIEGLEDEVEILQTSLDDESEQANQEISAAKQESESLRHQLQALKHDLSNAESVAAGAQAQIDAFRGDLEAGEGNKDQLASRLSDVEAQLAKLRLDKQGLQDQVASVNVEVRSLRASKTDLEAERDELQSQLRALKQQEEETFRLDQERVDLRTAKMKLDGEVRRLRDENNLTAAQKKTLERELQQEIDRATVEETRLNTEIHNLQKILRGSSEKRELSTAKKTIQHLEERVQGLESQITSAGANTDHTDALSELLIIRQDLAAARQRETEYLQREATQRDTLRGLKRQITELERKAHDAEISRLAVSSPHSSISGSARKSEIIEVRHQLATAHQTLKDLRTQLKDAERDAARKIKSATIEIQSQNEAWEIEKDQVERRLDEALLKRDELAAKNNTSEATITRLRTKIERLEIALQAERQNSGEDRTMALERRDLHEMLRETQLQAESLELVVKDRESTIAATSVAEAQLRAHLKRVRDERALHRSKATSAHEQLEDLERKFHKAREAWEAERKTLCKGVRFPNMSLSVNDESEILALRAEAEKREMIHVKEMRGMCMQIEWLRAKCRREEDFRAAAGYAKRYMGMQIDLYDACNKADLALLRSGSCYVTPPPKPVKKTTFRQVAIMIRATVRMKKGAEKWAKSRKIHDSIVAKVESMKRKSMRKSITSGR